MAHQVKAMSYVDAVLSNTSMPLLITNYRDQRNARPGRRRGALVWADTGAGKTTIGAGIAMRYMGTGRYVFVISSVDNIRGNNLKVYARQIKRHYPEYLEWWFGSSTVDLSKIESLLKKTTRFYSYTRLYNCLFGNTVACESIRRSIADGSFKSVFIIDEAHDLVSASNPGKTRTERVAIERLREFFLQHAPGQLVNAGTPRYHVYAMTATPGETRVEWYKMVQMVSPPMTLKEIHWIPDTEMHDKIVMVANLHGVTRGGTRVLAEERDVDVLVEYGNLHFIIVMATLGMLSSAKTMNDVRKLGMVKARGKMDFQSDAFLHEFRVLQNYLTVSAIKKAFKGILSDAGHLNKVYRELTGKNHMQLMTVNNRQYYVSPKLLRFRNIVKGGNPGKILAYTIDKKAAILMGRLLEMSTAGGRSYRDITTMVQTRLRNGVDPLDLTRSMSTAVQGGATKEPKQFMVATEPMFVPKAARVLDGREYLENVVRDLENRARWTNNNATRGGLMERLDKIKKKASKGDIVKLLIIGGGTFFQGLDISGLRGVHMMDYMGSYKHQKQLRGRGARGFGHAHLKPEDQNVDLLQYTMLSPPEFTSISKIEEYVHTFLSSVLTTKKEKEGLVEKRETLMNRIKAGLEFLRAHVDEVKKKTISNAIENRYVDNIVVSNDPIRTINSAMSLHQRKPAVRNVLRFEKMIRNKSRAT